MTSPPLLTICIPSYNRARHVEKLLRSICRNLLDQSRYSIDVIVINNASTDGTAAMLDAFPDKRIRHIDRTTHLRTAEENVFHSLDYCTGDYVWFLGDDDVPALLNFPDHYRRLAAGTHDFLIFNPSMMDPRGNISLVQNIKMNRDAIELPMSDLVVTIGCEFTLAGPSNCIIRRSLLSTERGLHYMARSHIYSMVAWIIDAARDARAVLINAPLVYYRENDDSTGHWPRVAKRFGVGDHHFWSAGIVDLLSELIDQRCLTPYQVGQIFEVNREGYRYSLIDDILYKYYQQMKTAQAKSQARQKYSEIQIDAAVHFFAQVDPTTFDIVEVLRDMALERGPFDKLDERFLQRFNERQSVGQWARRVSQLYKGYEILQTPIQLTAIAAGPASAREAVMKFIDPLPRPPLVLVSDTLDDLKRQIDDTCLHADIAQATANREFITEYASAIRGTNDAYQKLAGVYTSDIWQATYPYRAIRDFLGKAMTSLRRR